MITISEILAPLRVDVNQTVVWLKPILWMKGARKEYYDNAKENE